MSTESSSVRDVLAPLFYDGNNFAAVIDKLCDLIGSGSKHEVNGF
jgi:hypothetical protein